ncbi:MAG: glycosyltransferase family 2 protein [bacterium]
MTASANPHSAPRISVVMTVHNADAYVAASVESVLAQSEPSWELVAVDDGSTDASAAILAHYADPRVRVVTLARNTGRTPALRHACAKARGEYIAVLDADDIAHPERLAAQREFLDRHSDFALVGSWSEHIDVRGRVIARYKPPVDPEALHDSLGWTNPLVHSSAMFRRACAEEVGGYPEYLVYAQDRGLLLALARRHRIAMLDSFLCKMRIVPGSMTRAGRYRALIAREELSLLEYAAAHLKLGRESRRRNRRAIASTHAKLGVALARDGDLARGIASAFRAPLRDLSVLWDNPLFARWLGGSPAFLERCE